MVNVLNYTMNFCILLLICDLCRNLSNIGIVLALEKNADLNNYNAKYEELRENE
ncbi:hypothetical protein YYC_04138 [Plasmodium yoelii 17X]|uniref:Uncharacterized protein n=2 Tax=Plasmodium yoelii TaxID=5861 RepID=Q7RA90_PLAYO|nr:hypothetical protein [Plasmodium yoelii yoelii]ETB58046.1 hypothetical protein YYC_04138 [Plasmodium yoelii 17X]